MTNSATVIVLPESDDDTLCIEFTGLVRREDHQQNLRGNLEKMMARKGSYKMLIRYSHRYKGWEKDAADISMQSIIEFGKFAKKLAYVNPPQKKVFHIDISGPLFGGEVRCFEEGQYQQAVDWIKN